MYSIDSDGAPLYLTNLQDQYYTAPINTLAWSPDGSRLATGTTDGSIDIRFIKGGFGPINFFPLKYPTNDDGGAIDGLVWSPDSKLLAICGSGQLISICNAQSGKIIFQQQLTSANRTGLFSWSPDSNRFVIENGLPDHPPFRPALQVWNVKTRKMRTAMCFYGMQRMAPTSKLSFHQLANLLICSGRQTARTSPWKPSLATCRSGMYKTTSLTFTPFTPVS
jgi:WD40 repeat protein